MIQYYWNKRSGPFWI